MVGTHFTEAETEEMGNNFAKSIYSIQTYYALLTLLWLELFPGGGGEGGEGERDRAQSSLMWLFGELRKPGSRALLKEKVVS